MSIPSFWDLVPRADYDALAARLAEYERRASMQGHQEFCQLGETGACTCVHGLTAADSAPACSDCGDSGLLRDNETNMGYSCPAHSADEVQK